ncbi:calcium ion binding protein [Aureococcus anophagefferens]|uniref:Calcium ion binding protein n=1 Tax=Aureococcus anophagefferens TaxID=44056 RepID=A0ABR1FRM8_AURAN
MGALFYYENVGSAASPSYAAVTGSASPFDGIDIGSRSAPAFADVDGDGDLDLVVGISLGSLFYYENVGSAASPSYAAVTGAASPFYGIHAGGESAPVLADLDGDGDLDLVVGAGDGALYYYENVGSAASPSSRPSPAPRTPSTASTRAGTVFYYENVGNAASPRFEARTGSANPFDGIEVDEISKPEFADLDGDGDLDLVVGELMGALYCARTSGDGVLNYYENVGSAARASYAAVTGAANPFDGIHAGDGALYYYENVGSAASAPATPPSRAPTPFDGIDVGDARARAR